MYSAFLGVHSWLRWVVLLLGAVALVKAATAGGRDWTSSDDRVGRRFVMALDIQFLIGLILYGVLSPFTMDAWGDMAGTMRNAPLRFIVVEHQVGMLAALGLAHVGRVKALKAADAAAKHRTTMVFFGLSLVVMLLSVPWPFTPAGRPWLRGF